jgi:hypothetical protein
MVGPKGIPVRGREAAAGVAGRPAARPGPGPEAASRCPAARAGRLPAKPSAPPGACRFLSHCTTYDDPLVSPSVRISRGCLGPDDAYRKKHCKAFACRLLCGVLKAVCRELNSGRRGR